MHGLTPVDRGDDGLMRYLDRMEKSIWGGLVEEFSKFRTDIIEEDDHFLLQAELPGFQRERIRVAVEEGSLNIYAEHQALQEAKEQNFVRRERKYGSFSRNFSLDGVDTKSITANYENGILEVTLPKAKVEPKSPSRTIEVT